MGAQRPDDDTSDIAGLWEEALAEFKGSAKIDLNEWHFKSMDEAMASAEQQSHKFSSWRHDKGKVDYVRSLLGNNLNNIQKVVTGAKMAADAAGAFPPALPATMLMTAFTVVFQTFKDVKADYDRVSGFYIQMGAFFDQISMVENKSPKLAPFERCIRKVFSAMLTIAGIAADYKTKGRFKKWAKNLMDGGGDPKLAGAYGSMDDAIVKLHQAVGLATLSVLVDVQEVTIRIEGKADEILSSNREIKSVAIETREGVSALREGQEGIGLQIGGLQRQLTSGFEGITAQNQQLHDEFKKMMNMALKQSTSEKQAESKPEKGGKGKSAAAGSKRYKNAQVKRYFSDGADARLKIKAQRREIEESLVQGTTKWIFEDDTYKSWVDGKIPALWIAGDAGTGKSFLAHAITSNLEHRHDDHVSVASFFFREDQDALRSLRNALRCAVLQIADSNVPYLEKVAAEIAKESADEDPWSQFFTSRFPADSEADLYLVLDGVDEAHPTDQEAIAALIQQLPSAQLKIHVLFTGRTSLEEKFAQGAPATIRLSKERISQDLRLLTAARIRSLPRLRKFHRQTRRRIEQKLVENADSMLYVEHMLRRLSAIGREGAVLKDIDKSMPKTLGELYKLLLAECQKGRTHAQYLTLKTLFAMLAYSQRPLTLDEANDLVKLTDPDGTFDIEDEVIGRSARLLDLGRDQDDEADDEDDADNQADDSDNGSGDPDDNPLSDSGKSRIALQERSMRDYFRAVNVEEDGLRTTAEHSHLLIFELLIRLLCDEAPPSVEEKPCLHAYAAQYWAHHFVEVDVAPEHAVKVLAGLSTILNNEHNIAASFETYKAFYYDDLESATSFLAKVKAWFELAQTVDDVPAASKEWAHSLVDTPGKALLPLARGHVSNQFDPMSERLVENTFLYARSALVTAGVFTVSDDEKDDIVKVLEYFPDVDSHSVDAYRAISHVLQRRAQYEASEEYATKALELPDPNPRTRFKVHWLQAYNLYMAGWQMNLNASAAAEEEGDAEEDDAEDSTNAVEPSGNTPETGATAESKGLVQPTTEAPSVNGETEVADPSVADVDEAEKVPLPGAAKLEEALQHIVAALALVPEGWRNDKNYPKSMEGILILKGSSLRALKRIEDALAAYHESRAVQPGKDNMFPATLSAMLNMEQHDVNSNSWSDEAVNPAGYFDILDSWTPGERLKFITFLMEVDYYDGANAGWALHKCAHSLGERGHKITIGLYEAYFKSVSRTSSKWAVAKSDFALFYKLAAGDLEKACEQALEILDVEYSDDDVDSLDYLLYNVRQQLCDALFQRFRESSDPKEKLKLLDTLKNLPVIKIGSDEDEAIKKSEEELNESPILVMQALMTRTVGSPVEFHEMMDKMFKTCVDGLTDKIGNNDSQSLRLLAKALACVPGLERDAQIALSCQFSITDPEVEHYEESSSDDESGSGEETDEDAEEEEQETGGTAEVPAAGVTDQTETVPSKGLSNGLSNGANSESGGVKTDVTVTTTAVEITQPQLAELGLEIAANMEQALNGEQIKERTEGEKGEEGKEKEGEEEDVVGDLLPDSERGAGCDGNCGLGITDWTKASLYMCIHCGNCDLCEDCYEKRMAWNQGEPNTTFWYDWCGRDHAYIKGPIDGWRGVKNGVIRVEEEEIEFKEWLRVLKEERWPKAWENFWKGESFFRTQV